MDTPEIANFFSQSDAHIVDNSDLREPQIQGWLKARDHFREHAGSAVIQLPVGCGKTGLMALLPFGISQGRVLVIAPNLEIRRGISTAFDISGRDCFWTDTRTLESVSRGPYTAVLDGANANLHDCEESHIVVTNIQQLASRAERWLPAFSSDFFDLILVDEGHHNVANSWEQVFNRFPNAKVISLTATPFRGDGREISGDLIYSYPFRTAMEKGYIKQITSVNVAPQQLSFTYRGDSHAHSLEEVLALREEDWFSRGVALAPECNRSIVDASIQWLNHLRETDTFHQIIAVACSVDHARQVRSLYSERGLTAKEIHSNMSKAEIDQTIQDLRRDRLDCIVQVRMLGEGFNHPRLSVAAIFQPFRSLSPYVQFVGRAMRVIHNHNPGHLDNRGIVVSHVGLNIDRHWEDFRRIDEADQAMVKEWLSAEEKQPPPSRSRQRKQLTPSMVVQDEIIGHFIEQSYLDPSDDAAIDDLIAQFKRRGIDPESIGLSRNDLRQRLEQARSREQIRPQPQNVTPQRQRQELRRRLAERCKTLSNRIIEALGTSVAAHDICIAFPELGSVNNYGAVIQLVNNAVNERLDAGSGERGEHSIGALTAVHSALDEIGDLVQSRIEQRMGKEP